MQENKTDTVFQHQIKIHASIKTNINNGPFTAVIAGFFAKPSSPDSGYAEYQKQDKKPDALPAVRQRRSASLTHPAGNVKGTLILPAKSPYLDTYEQLADTWKKTQEVQGKSLSIVLIRI